MSYCPEHGHEMSGVVDTASFALYECPDGEQWMYSNEEATYQSIETYQLLHGGLGELIGEYLGEASLPHTQVPQEQAHDEQ